MSSSIYKPILKERNYMQYLTAGLISRFGDSIDAIAYSWLMYEVTDNASLIAFIMALNYLPTICLQPFAAVLVERMEKKRVHGLTSIGRGLIVLCTMLLYVSGRLGSGWLMAATVLTSSLEAFSMPAGNALVPQLIPIEKITAAESLSSSAGTLVELAGMGVAGSIIASLGSHTALFIDFVTFVLSAFLVLSIPFHEERKTAELTLRRYRNELAGGFRYVKNNKLLLAVIGIGMALNAVNVPFSSFQSIFVAEYLKLDAQALSVFGVTMMVGMLLGSVLSPKLNERLGTKKSIVISGMMFSPFYFLSAYLPVSDLPRTAVYSVSIAGLLLLGVGMGQMSVLFNSLFVQTVKQEYLARVSGITNALLTSMMPVTAAVCSFLAIFLRINVIFLMVGICNLLIYLFAAGSSLFSFSDDTGKSKEGE